MSTYTNGTEDEDSPFRYTYSVSGNTLTMKERSSETIESVYKIEKLTSSQLVLFLHEEEWLEAENRKGEFEQTEIIKKI